MMLGDVGEENSKDDQNGEDEILIVWGGQMFALRIDCIHFVEADKISEQK
jgi:hypothetical protein